MTGRTLRSARALPALVVLVLGVALAGCGRDSTVGAGAEQIGPSTAPCTENWVADMIPDFTGAPDPAGAVRAWLDLDPSSLSAPEPGTPRDGWVPRDGDPEDATVFTNVDREVTVLRSTRGEWAVTAVSCSL